MDNPLSQNLYIYCMNNPVNYVDPSGYRCEPNGTASIGLNLAGTPSFWQFAGSIAILFDTKGNIAIQITGVGGLTGGTPGAS